MPIRGFPEQNVVACFDEPNSSGDVSDYDAPRNAPVKNPESYLSDITFHSDFFQYEVAAGPTDVTINHPGLAVDTTIIGMGNAGGGFNPVSPPRISVTIYNNVSTTDTLLLTHNLGYVPKFMIALGGNRIPDGYTVQSGGNYRRRVSFWANTTGVYIRTSSYSGDEALPAATRVYRVIVFRDSEATPGLPLFGGGPGDPLILARGVIDSSKKYLRRVGVGDTPFAQNLGRTLDCGGGRLASASGGVVVAESGYTGSLVAPPFIQVGVD